MSGGNLFFIFLNAHRGEKRSGEVFSSSDARRFPQPWKRYYCFTVCFDWKLYFPTHIY